MIFFAIKTDFVVIAMTIIIRFCTFKTFKKRIIFVDLHKNIFFAKNIFDMWIRHENWRFFCFAKKNSKWIFFWRFDFIVVKISIRFTNRCFKKSKFIIKNFVIFTFNILNEKTKKCYILRALFYKFINFIFIQFVNFIFITVQKLHRKMIKKLFKRRNSFHLRNLKNRKKFFDCNFHFFNDFRNFVEKTKTKFLNVLKNVNDKFEKTWRQFKKIERSFRRKNIDVFLKMRNENLLLFWILSEYLILKNKKIDLKN